MRTTGGTGHDDAGDAGANSRTSKLAVVENGGLVTLEHVEVERDPLTLRILGADRERRTFCDRGRQLVEKDDYDAMLARVTKLERIVEAQQVVITSALPAIQARANIQGEMDATTLQLVDGLKILARAVGIRNLPAQIGITEPRGPLSEQEAAWVDADPRRHNPSVERYDVTVTSGIGRIIGRRALRDTLASGNLTYLGRRQLDGVRMRG